MVTNDMFSTNYNPTLGNFLNGVYINSSSNFVDSIGGAMDGQLEMILNVPSYGEYVLTLTYLGYGKDRILKLEVNGSDTGNIYVLTQTNSDIPADSKDFSTIITLNAGDNLIKIHGNGFEDGPSIGNINIRQVTNLAETPTLFSAAPTVLVTNYDAALGTLSNGAYINIETNFVDGIGGVMNGAVEVPVTVDRNGDYNLTFSYLSLYSNAILMLSVNGVDYQNSYFMFQTPGSGVNSAQTFSILVPLQAGTNIVKFYGNGNDIGPSIGTFTLNAVETMTTTINNDIPTPVFSAGPTVLVTNYDAALGTLSNGAYINVETNFVDNLGGMADGTVEVPLSVDKDGQYNLSISYLANYDSNSLKVDINAYDSGNIYYLPVTNGNIVQNFNMVINLISGSNLIKFHGNGMDKAPSIGTFIINQIEVTTTVDNTTTSDTTTITDSNATPVFSAGPITTLITNYDAAFGALSNGASINAETNFVDNLGGPTDGSVEVPLSVDQDGQYNLQLNYLSPLNNTALKLDVNDVDSGDVYFILETLGSTIYDAQKFNVMVTLKAGNNKIKFHGNGVDMAPNIGTFSVNFVQHSTNEISNEPTPVFSAGPTTLVTNYDAALGTLLNSASINTITNFVDNLGGAMDGAVEIPLSVDKDGQYNLQLNYLSPLVNTLLTVDVNDINLGDIYFIPQTMGNTVYHIQNFNITVNLKAGTNKVRFHGNGTDMAPSIGTFSINFLKAINNEVPNELIQPTPVFSAGPATLITNYDAALGTLSNNALINEITNFVDNLGGAMDGAVEVPLSVDQDGQYNLEIKYLSPFENTILRVDVNDIDSRENYFIAQTVGSTIDNAQSFNIVITLKSGSNKVKFHGNGLDRTPSIGTFVITAVSVGSDAPSVFATSPMDSISNYDSALGVLSNGSTVNETTNFVDNLGGYLDGAVEIPLTVHKEGRYNLELKYLSALNNTSLKVDVNDFDSEEIYFIAQTHGSTIDYVNTFNLVINLMVGTNKIKFHGDGMNMAPSIGTFSITPIAELTSDPASIFATGPNVLVTNYDAAMGVLSNGSIVNSTTNFVDHIGGELDGSVDIPLSVDKDGEYNLEFKYLSPYSNTRLKVNIDTVDLGNNYFVAQTTGDTLNDVQLYNIIVTLKAGINIIRFHGNGIDMAPSIGSFIISFIGTTPDKPSSVFATASVTVPTDYDAALGTIGGKASINSNTKMLDNIGGSQLGSSTISVTVNADGDYVLDIKYLSPNGTSKLKIDIDNISTTTIYSLGKTNGNALSNSQSFNTTLKLKSGINKVKFYGDSTNNGLSIGKFTIKPSTLVNIQVYNPTTGSLSNGAIINPSTKFIDNIGGKIEGTVKVPVTVNDSGIYSLAINYLSPNGNNNMKLIINDVTTVTVPPLVKTIGTASTSIKSANISVKLNKGINTIKITGDKSFPTFSIGIFTVLLTTIVNDVSNTGALYDITTASLSNGAVINKTTKFVDNIGGKLKGTAEMTIDIPNNGPYYLDLNYLASSGNSNLKIDINNKNTGTIYYMQKTNGNTNSDVKVYNTPLDLLSGKYKIKFYGDGTNIGPSLGNFSITPITIINMATVPIIPTSPLSKEYYLSKGIFKDGATINKTTNFVEGLGGQDDGNVEVKVATIPSDATYLLSFQYLSPDDNSSLQISINGEDSGDSYTLAQTNSGDIKDALLFSKVFLLSKNTTTILFHGNGLDDGPSFEKFILTPIKVEKSSSTQASSIFSAIGSNSLITNYDVALGTLKNEAIINESTSFVDNIGGVQDGESEVVLTVYDSGEYNLDLKYLSPYENTNLKIMINGVDLEEDYFIPLTLGNSVEEARIFSTTINLTEGKNLVKFHGNKINNGPSLGTFIISLVNKVNNDSSLFSTSPAITLITDYNASLGALSNNASIDSTTNFVYNLGGINDGTVEVVLSVENSGQYDLTLQYLSPYANSYLKIDVNGFDLNNVYYIPKTTGNTIDDAQLFNEKIDLISGNNVIKFHGNGVDVAPWIRMFTIEPVDITNNSSTTSNSSVFSAGPSQNLITDYEAAFGILSNEAIINETTNFVDNLGGPLDGSVTVTLTVDKEGAYRLDLGYLSIYGNSILKFDINGIDSGETHFISTTNQYDPENLNVFHSTINLLEGENTIKFHGDGVNLAPSVGSFILTSLIEESNMLTMNYLSVDEKKN